MDLSFSRLLPVADAPLPAADMALLVALVSAQQGASDTAQAQAALDRPADIAPAEPLLAPASGTFSAAMAARLVDWRHE